jgi:hypothetical protein
MQLSIFTQEHSMHSLMMLGQKFLMHQPRRLRLIELSISSRRLSENQGAAAIGASVVVARGIEVVATTNDVDTGREGSPPPLLTISPMPIPTIRPKIAPLAPTMSFN